MAFPFDQSFKLLSEEDAIGSLRHLAGIQLPPDAVIESLDRELNPERLHADHLYLVRDGAKQWIHHFEALSSYRAGWEDPQIDHAIQVRMKYRMPLFSHLLLLHSPGAPPSIPERIVRVTGSLRQSLRVNVIRLWKRPAGEVLATNRIALYPWTVLMDATLAQQREAARRLMTSGREGLRMQMTLLGALRYGSRESFFERIGRMLLTKEILRESPFWQEIEREGELKGELKGEAGQRRMFRRFLEARFGALPDWAEDKISAASTDVLEALTGRAATAPTLESVFD
jgi:predicted transposase YdaD